MKIYSFTHQGPNPKYNHNEDSVLINEHIFSNGDFTYQKNYFFKKIGVFSVCDGVGGHIGGEIASNSLVNTLSQYLKYSKVNSISDIHSLLYELKRNIEIVQEDYDCYEMMSTFSCLFLNKKQLLSVNVGDTPIFLYRDKKLEMLSTLDTYENKLRQDGYSEEEITKIDTSHMITSAFGLKGLSIYSAHIKEEKPKRKDKYILMSDGVYDFVKEDELLELLKKHSKTKELIKHIEALVIERGAKDNYSLIVIEY